jgi:hemolysin III
MTLADYAQVMHAASQIAVPDKPLLRGVIHQVFFYVSVVAGVLLVQGASPGRSTLAAVVYATSLATLLGVSALYHRRRWAPRLRAWMRRLDHACIFLLIAGTLTPISLVLTQGRGLLLLLFWIAATAGVLKAMLWPYAPKWLNAGLCVAMGWAGVGIAPAVSAVAGSWALSGLFAGGVLYSVGAVIYALKRPNPAPGVFGYHEVFHALVVAAAACHYFVVRMIVDR